jgi:hypothetical protein
VYCCGLTTLWPVLAIPYMGWTCCCCCMRGVATCGWGKLLMDDVAVTVVKSVTVNSNIDYKQEFFIEEEHLHSFQNSLFLVFCLLNRIQNKHIQE